VKKVKTRTQAILLSAFLFTAMIPTAAFANSENIGATTMDKVTASAGSGSTGSGQGASQNSMTTSTASISKEKAEELARKNVNIPEEYTLQGASLSTERLINGTRNVWSLDFTKRVNGKYIGSIYVQMNADSGQITGFNNYNNDTNVKPSYPLKVERDAAQSIASSFIKEIAGDFANQVRFNEHYGEELLPALTGAVQHRFRFDRVVNGLAYLDNYVDVTVDSEGHVAEYYFVWDDSITFPKIDNYISLEQANQKLQELSEPVLSYIVTNSGNDKGKPILSYHLDPLTINAVTGEKLTASTSYRYYRPSENISETAVTDKPLAAKPKIDKLTEDLALRNVKAAFTLPDGAELNNSSYNEYVDSDTGKSTTSWHFSWTVKQDGKEVGNVWATVDGATGGITNYHASNYNEESEQAKELVPLEKATTTAIETVKKQLPWLTNELYLIKPDPKQYEYMETSRSGYYYIGFKHKLHGANIDYDSITVTIDARTGNVRGFEAYIQPYTYESKAPATIAKQNAVEKWMDYYRTELTYRVVSEYSWNGQPLPIEKYNVMVAAGEISPQEEVDSKAKIELVYQLIEKPRNERIFLDAVSGQWRTFDKGDVTGLERQKINDIDNHWAKHQLELMVAYKALDVVDGKVRPNELIKRGELIKMLVIARSGGNYGYATADGSMKASFNDVSASSEYFAYVEAALQQNLIDIGDGSFNPDETVTREEMAELIVRALGYNTLAQYDNLFVNNFSDVDHIQKKGQATIVVGLKIMSLTEDGKFLPQKQVQRAEAATAFFRYLQARSDLQEAPLRM